MKRPPVSEDRRRLGLELQLTRRMSGRSTRQVNGYSTGHVSQVENGHVLPSARFIKVYVAMGGNAGRLFSMLDRARSSRDGPPGQTALHEPSLDDFDSPYADPHLLRRGYTVDTIDDTYLIGAARGPLQNHHRVLIRPDPRARFFPFRYAFEEDPRPGVATVAPGPGCTIPVLEEAASGTIYAVVAFDPTTVDETGAVELSWTITIDSPVPVRPQVMGGAVAPIPHAVAAVVFTPPALPSRVWWYRDFDTAAGTMAPTPERILNPDSGHRYSHEWHDLNLEWWGLAWDWPPT